MAGRNEQIAIDITAKDNASKVIDKLAKNIDGLEADEARITVTAETAKLEKQLDRARQKLEGLEGDEATVQARLVGTIEEDLEQANKLLEQLDGQTATVKIDSVGARDGIDKLGKSADSSKSVLANMVGNTTQDLGALGGVAGSAGVAIGQMGEYMADAAADGDKLGTIFRNFAKVGVPIAAVTLAMKGITDHFKQIAQTKAFRTEQIEKWSDALREGETLLESINDELEKTGSIEVRGLEKTFDIVPLLADAELGIKDWTKAVEGGVDEQRRFLEIMRDSGLSKTELVDVAIALKTATEDYTASQVRANDAAAVSGRQASKSAKGLGEQKRAAQEAKEAADDYAVAVSGASDAIAGLAGTFNQYGIREGALAAVFEVGSSGLEAASTTRDIAGAIGELGEAAKDVDLSAALDPTNLKADELLDAFDALRPQIQGKIQEAFAVGGPEAAKATADSYVAQIVESLGGRLTPAEVEQLLGLTDLTAQIAVALEISKVDSVKQQLAILTGLNGETPYTASILLALDTGTISADAAEILVQPLLTDAGVTIPAELDTPDTAEAIAEAQSFADDDPVVIPTDADTGDAKDSIGEVTDADHKTTITAKTDKKTAAADLIAEETKFRKANILAQALTLVARHELDGLTKTLRTPVDAYLDDYPTASEIAARIGVVRVPVDTYVRNTVRITGLRD